MRSIKKQLVASIFSIIFISFIGLFGITYYELKDELDELYDENIRQIASAVSVSEVEMIKNGLAPKTLKGEEEFLIQIWNAQDLVYSSHSLTPFPRQDEGGVRTVPGPDGAEWRYYAIEHDDWLIQVSQPLSERHILIWEIYAQLLIPMLLLLPVLAGLIWFVVGVGFKPLKKISSSIEKRGSHFLDGLPEEDVPQEVGAMVCALNSLLGRLDESLKSQRRFTADAAHELRTPLTAISLQLDILGRAKSKADREEAVQSLHKGVDRSTHLVRQLLEIARQEPGAEDAAFGVCDLRDVLTEVAEQYALMAQDKDIALGIYNDMSAPIRGDANALSILVGNLVNNAVLYAPKGGRVEVSLSKAAEGFLVKVADNGIGIAEEERGRVFDRFYRVVGTKTSGSGLGLSIVQTIAERHGARVSIGDGLGGRGVSFTVVFSK
jgi:two-component system OmpR family sensor kinase